MDFDPLTGKLWDLEDGPKFGDEINLIEPGFNSGWRKVQGIWKVLPKVNESPGDLAPEKPDNLVDFDGRGKHSSPEFTWNTSVGPTTLKFLSTDKLGKQYENDMLVADEHNQRIYHFELNQNRTALSLQGPLIDKVADSDKELDNVIFAGGFGLITDLEIGPDGYLYFVVFDEGKIYRITTIDQNDNIGPI
jgi:glucose/arabinose dehydrogenase